MDKVQTWLHNNAVMLMILLGVLIMSVAMTLTDRQSLELQRAEMKIAELETEIQQLQTGERPIIVADRELQEKALELVDRVEQLQAEVTTLRRQNAQLRVDYQRAEKLNTRLLNLIGTPEYADLRAKVYGYTDSERAGLNGLIEDVTQ